MHYLHTSYFIILSHTSSYTITRYFKENFQLFPRTIWRCSRWKWAHLTSLVARTPWQGPQWTSQTLQTSHNAKSRLGKTRKTGRTDFRVQRHTTTYNDMFDNDLKDVWEWIQGVSYWQDMCMHWLQSSGKQPLVAASVLLGAQDSQAMISVLYLYIYIHITCILFPDGLPAASHGVNSLQGQGLVVFVCRVCWTQLVIMESQQTRVLLLGTW